MVDPDPNPIINVDPPPDAPFIAFTVYYEGYSEVVIAPLDQPRAYRKISPGVGQYKDPRFSPSKSKVLFRDQFGVTYLYDVGGDSSYVLNRRVGGELYGIKTTTRSAFWSQDEGSFVFDHNYFGITESMDVSRYDIPGHTFEQLLGGYSFEFAVSRDTVVVMGGSTDPAIGHMLHLYSLDTRNLKPINNSFLIVPHLPHGSSPRVMHYLDWNAEQRLVAFSVRETNMPSWERRTAITNMDGSLATYLTTGHARDQKPGWGPGNTVYFERQSNESDYRAQIRTFRLLVLDLEKNTIREFVSHTSFTGAIGVGSCDI